LATQTIRRLAALAAVALIAAACSDSAGPTAAPAPNASVAAPHSAAGSPPGLAIAAANRGKGPKQLLACTPPHPASQGKAVIGPDGGTLVVGGNAIAIPPGAVPTPTSFTLSVAGGPVVRVEIRAGNAQQYVFQRPVQVTIDYSRCGSAVDALPPLSAWYVGNGGNALLEEMAGLDDRQHRRIFFATDHLSGYAVAF
jgi:hypothetical protein